MSKLLPDDVEIREVYAGNLEDEFEIIRSVVDRFPYVAMDTEFPGVVLRPIASFSTQTERNYCTLKANVDLLKMIQLGLTFFDAEGNLPTSPDGRSCIWQFNFREFNTQTDMFANDSVELLRQSGIDFKKNSEEGVDALRFAELLMSSGVVLNDEMQWITFHSAYDFGYMLKVLTCCNLPDSRDRFFELINMYFPVVYDVKHMMKYCNSLHGGLSKLAELLELERVGVSHQAGSDSLLTAKAFRKLKDMYFGGDVLKYEVSSGVLKGTINGKHDPEPDDFLVYSCNELDSLPFKLSRLMLWNPEIQTSSLPTGHFSIKPCRPDTGDLVSGPSSDLLSSNPSLVEVSGTNDLPMLDPIVAGNLTVVVSTDQMRLAHVYNQMCQVVENSADDSIEAYLGDNAAASRLRKNFGSIEAIYEDVNRLLAVQKPNTAQQADDNKKAFIPSVSGMGALKPRFRLYLVVTIGKPALIPLATRELKSRLAFDSKRFIIVGTLRISRWFDFENIVQTVAEAGWNFILIHI